MLKKLEKKYFENYSEYDGYPSKIKNSELFIKYKDEINGLPWTKLSDELLDMLKDGDRKWFVFNLLGVIDNLPEIFLDPIIYEIIELQCNITLLSPLTFSASRIFGFEKVEACLSYYYSNCKSVVRKSAINSVFAENRPPLDLNWEDDGRLQPLEIYDYVWNGKFYKIDMIMYTTNDHLKMVENIELLLKKRYYMLGSTLIDFNYCYEYRHYLLSILPSNKHLYHSEDKEKLEIVFNHIIASKKNV